MPGENGDSGALDPEERAFQYAQRVVRLFNHLAEGPGGSGAALGERLLDAAVSIGLNLGEAHSADSPEEAARRLALAAEGGRKSLYWLKLLAAASIVPEKRLEPLIKETEELIASVAALL